MNYESMMFCNHANECPTSICTCPPNCGCREMMCKIQLPKLPRGSGDFVLGLHGTLQRNGRVLATFTQCRFWGTPQGEFEAWGAQLELTEDTVRDVVAGKLPIVMFNGVSIELQLFDQVMSKPINMVWGDFVLFETGEPVIRNFIGVPDSFHGLPPPAVVRRVLALLKASKNPL